VTGDGFGQAFRVSTFGESHGPALGAILEGCPPGLALAEEDLQADLDRRRPGTGPHVSQRREADRVRILSGVYEGRTTGTAIGLLVANEDARPADYRALAEVFRPGHADYTYFMKYGRRDPRGGGRASARETVMRVAAGAVARRLLETLAGVRVAGWLDELGPWRHAGPPPERTPENAFFVPDPQAVPHLDAYLEEVRRARDSVGARVGVVARGVPAGWGDPVFDKLDALIAHALMSIGAVKAVEIGDGTRVVRQRGSEHRDALTPAGFTSNHAGGILGGISSGQDVVAYLSFKPTSSIPQEIATLDVRGAPTTVAVRGRHDPCVGVRGVPVAEAMLALVLADAFLRQRAQCAGFVPPRPPCVRP
jgi:chorismate synthase